VAALIKAPGIMAVWGRICRELSVSVLNPHFIGLEYLPLALLRRTRLFKGRLILSLHGADIREMIQSRGLTRAVSKFLLRSADRIVPCSEGLREETLMFVPDCAAKTVAVANGVNVERFLSQETAAPLPEPFSSRKVLLNVAAYEYKKGHDILLRAFALVRQSKPGAALVIAGARGSGETARLAADLGLERDVLLLENRPYGEIVALLRRADLFVLSSRWEKGVCGEGFAMALLEAGAAGKPVVSTLSCGVSELLTDGETARIVPTENPAALANAITETLEDPIAAARMASRLHDRVRREFTWERAYERYLALAREGNSQENKTLATT
jgi:glycosyltransferase involved in cell wall biosynthesis